MDRRTDGRTERQHPPRHHLLCDFENAHPDHLEDASDDNLGGGECPRPVPIPSLSLSPILSPFPSLSWPLPHPRLGLIPSHPHPIPSISSPSLSYPRPHSQPIPLPSHPHSQPIP
ncbi:PREDICTED: early nodulin-20-like, partial [Leptosomus discolor]|uniref:early nodulin-20-like n=1 Tax=Leptosomus discolor TaxID=188344 RepID=UPI00052285A1